MGFLRRWLLPFVVTALVVAFFLLAVFPTRTLLDQRAQMDATEARLSVLRDENARLASRVAELKTDEEIERLARSEYNLVKPGERAFAMLPPPAPPTTTTTTTPPAPGTDAGEGGSWWSRAWSALRGD